MSITATAPIPDQAAPAPRPPPAGRSWKHAARLVLGGLVGALLTTEVVLAWPSVVSAAAALAGSSGGWLAVAAVAAAASMVAFGAVRQCTLRAAGVSVPLRRAVSMSYAAGALHTSLPGGTVISTAYAFKRLRAWGASGVVASWCLAVTGLLATATLSVIGLTGVLLGGGTTGSVVQSAGAVVVVALAIAGLVRLTRSPHRLGAAAGQVLRWINRLRGRPAETGYQLLATLIGDLQTIRPSRRAWLRAWVLSLLNWTFDVVCLAASCAALGVHVSVPALLLTYTAGMAASSLTALPGGVGVVEAALILGLTTAGAPLAAALGAVLVYRVLSLGGVVVIGWGVLAVHRLRPADHGGSVTGRNVLGPGSGCGSTGTPLDSTMSADGRCGSADDAAGIDEPTDPRVGVATAGAALVVASVVKVTVTVGTAGGSAAGSLGAAVPDAVSRTRIRDSRMPTVIAPIAARSRDSRVTAGGFGIVGSLLRVRGVSAGRRA